MFLKQTWIGGLLSIIVVFLWVIPAQAKLPKAVQIDKHKKILLNALQNKRYKTALKHMAILEELSSNLPLSLTFHKGNCYYELGEYSQAFKVLETYLSKVNSDDNNYEKALDLYIKAERKQEEQKGHWRDSVTGMEFAWVPKGCYKMGGALGEEGRKLDEAPVHEVCVDGFFLGKYEVTNAQYREYKSNHYSKDFKGHSLNGENQPAVYVNWNNVKAYAEWLSSKNGGRYEFRLPTEAEWEYAARAGTKTARYWGDNPDKACRYANVHDWTSKMQFSNFTWKNHHCNDTYVVSAPVGSFKANAFGLFDMLGNVWEWCGDIYTNDAYGKHTRNAPYINSGGSKRVIRGGGWGYVPRRVRSANRSSYSPDLQFYSLGFRLLRTATDFDLPD